MGEIKHARVIHNNAHFHIALYHISILYILCNCVNNIQFAKTARVRVKILISQIYFCPISKLIITQVIYNYIYTYTIFIYL